MHVALSLEGSGHSHTPQDRFCQGCLVSSTACPQPGGLPSSQVVLCLLSSQMLERGQGTSPMSLKGNTDQAAVTKVLFFTFRANS